MHAKYFEYQIKAISMYCHWASLRFEYLDDSSGGEPRPDPEDAPRVVIEGT